jgi:hypothetical protein
VVLAIWPLRCPRHVLFEKRLGFNPHMSGWTSLLADFQIVGAPALPMPHSFPFCLGPFGGIIHSQ